MNFGRVWLTSIFMSLGLVSCAMQGFAQSGAAAPVAGNAVAGNAVPAYSRAAKPGVTPADRLREGWWAARHEAVLALVKSSPEAELIYVGDSITQNYEKNKLPDENFQPTWQEFYAPRRAINLGYSADTTENVLWRLDHGEVDGLHPAVAVVLIGTNNTGFRGETAAATEQGIDAVVQSLEAKLPMTRIVLLAILPSGQDAVIVAKNDEVNAYLAAQYGPETGAADARVTYLDIAPIFYKDGKLDEAIFYDPRLPQHGKALHPDTVGQHRMAEAIEPTLVHLMGDGGRQYLTTLHEVNTATLPVPRLEHDSYDWYERHRAVLELKKTLNPEVVLIGDSITHFWGGQPVSPAGRAPNGPKSWDEAFGGLSVLNLGFGWDRTQNVLWRLAQGEFDGLHPKTVVINIGTNNLAGTGNARSNTPEEVVEGIVAIEREVHRKSPESRIIVMGILPRGFNAMGVYRGPILKVNALLGPALAAEPNVTYLDIGVQFLASDGSLSPALMGDGTHPTDLGYAIWARALAPLLTDAGVRKP